MLNNPEESLVDSRKRKVMEVQRLWFFLLVVPTLLVACGGEREEPFDPGEPDEEIRERVPTEFLADGSFVDFNFPLTDSSGDGKRLEVIRNIDDFAVMLDIYDYTEFVEDPDFEEGQVLLYDGGWIDDSACEQQLVLHRTQAYSITEDESLVEVVLTYRRALADDDLDCDEEILYRPFEFRYIESRGEIIIVEEVQGVSDNDSSDNEDNEDNEDDDSDNTNVQISVTTTPLTSGSGNE